MERTIDLTPIPNAPPYALSKSGYVYNVKTNKRMKRQWIGNSWRTNIRRPDGKTSFYFRHNDIDSAARKERFEDVLSREETKGIPGWSRYEITPYGTVWCVSAGTRGRGAGGPFIVSEFTHRNKSHVNLTNKFGVRRRHSVESLIRSAWGGTEIFEKEILKINP